MPSFSTYKVTVPSRTFYGQGQAAIDASSFTVNYDFFSVFNFRVVRVIV